MDIVTPLATAIGAGVAAGIAGFRLAKGRLEIRPPATYVRLSAEDSDRVEKISALLERVIALQGQTQAALDRLAYLVTESRLEQARRHGELVGRLGGLERRGREATPAECRQSR